MPAINKILPFCHHGYVKIFYQVLVTDKLRGQNKNVRFVVLIVVIKNYCLMGR